MQQFNRLDAGDLDLILKTLREFADREAPLDKRLEWDESDVCPEDVVRAMLSPEVGLHLVFLPAEYDGMGGGAYDVYRLSRRVREDRPRRSPRRCSPSPSAPTRSASAAPTSRRRSGCTRIANEGLIVAYGVTEPEAGSNVENLKTTAERITDDDRQRHPLPAERRQAVHLQRRRSPTSTRSWPRRRTARPSSWSSATRRASPRASTRRSTASACPTPPRSLLQDVVIPADEHRRRRRKARGSSRRTRCSASRG